MDFEDDPSAGEMPEGWAVGGYGGYRIVSDPTEHADGNWSGRINSTPSSGQFGTLMQCVDASPYRTGGVQLVGSVKTSGVSGWAGLWMRVDGPNGQVLSFDNMQDRPVKGTIDWTPKSVILDVAPSAVRICFGILLAGEGTVWMDNLSLAPMRR